MTYQQTLEILQKAAFMSMSHSELIIDLNAVAHNWHCLNSMSGHAVCGAVVKADAYGLGMQRVAPVLAKAGCHEFFVASLEEGIELRNILGHGASIYVFSGVPAGQEYTCVEHDLIPVLISLEMLQRWAGVVGSNHPASIKVDTGMHRLGLSVDEFKQCLQNVPLFGGLNIVLIMSHLACADEPDHHLNKEQLSAFEAIRKLSLSSDAASIFPSVPRFSLANSAGTLLGSDYHYDLVRPGIVLYGGQAYLAQDQVQPVVRLSLSVLQHRECEKGESIGYGASHRFSRRSRVAVAAGGYADGILRALGNNGYGYFHGQQIPIVGRVSMDSVCFDITDAECVDDGLGQIELIGPSQSVDQFAERAGTIAYEILCGLGKRYSRRYLLNDSVLTSDVKV